MDKFKIVQNAVNISKILTKTPLYILSHVAWRESIQACMAERVPNSVETTHTTIGNGSILERTTLDILTPFIE